MSNDHVNPLIASILDVAIKRPVPKEHAMTAAKPKPETYAVGACRFKDKAVAEEVATTRAKFAAAVNREGIPADEKAAAFVAFFNKR